MSTQNVANARETLIPMLAVPAAVAAMTGAPAPHPATVARWRSSGVRGRRLAIQRIGGRIFVRPADLRAFLASND